MMEVVCFVMVKPWCYEVVQGFKKEMVETVVTDAKMIKARWPEG
jgi:hypothetical protein